MEPETVFCNSLAENIVDPAICMGSCPLANSRGMPITTLHIIPMQGSGDLCEPEWRCSPLAAGLLLLCLPSGLGWVMDWLPGQWLWILTALCHGLPWKILWPKPYGSCCRFVPKKLGDLQVLMSGRMWSWPSERARHSPEPQHQWMWLDVPWLTGAPALSPPVGKAHLAVVAGLFQPNTAGPWHMPRSFGAALCGNPAHQTSYWKEVGTNHSPESKGPVALNNCQPPLGHSYSP